MADDGWRIAHFDPVRARMVGATPRGCPRTGQARGPAPTSTTGTTALQDADLDPDCVVEDGGVLFSWSGSLECVLWAGGKGALNQHLFKVTSAEFPKWFYYFWIHHHLPDFRHIAAGKATTMGHIQRHHLSDALVVAPPPSVSNLRLLDEHLRPMVDSIVARALESSTLAALRDALLPKLLSGELRVKDAEWMVGSAV